MWGNRKQREKLAENHKELQEDVLGGYGSQPSGGYNSKAEEKRGTNRKGAKELNPDLVISEEDEAIEEGRKRNMSTSEDGQQLADDVVDKKWWQ